MNRRESEWMTHQCKRRRQICSKEAGAELTRQDETNEMTEAEGQTDREARLRMCFHCKQQPDAPNEISTGKWASAINIVWYLVKKGVPMYDGCLLCWLTFSIGGFKDQFGGLRPYKAHVQQVTPEAYNLTD